ncbi:biogenesis of lysosome-related organelles complex 1 subunit 5 [Spea bombifrons]|uniref:biogenesis of lysosome-related organelles complex 1 subunit 5 n=1 Tax=Spea bombifrons TaxID=233779 RepID=UPI00234994C7|nr:biogenesis of lysosome-related organelles complex 1 subunit 5 [Spea bombifrons]
MSRQTPSKSGSPPVQNPKPRDNITAMGAATELIMRDVGEIHSRLLDHRPVIQGETRYFVKEFEEKRGHREMRVLGNLKNSIWETKEQTLPKCVDLMQDQLGSALKKLENANVAILRLQENGQEKAKNDLRKGNNEKLRAHWEIFMEEQHQKRLAVDEEHRKAMMRLKEQYAEMGKDLSKIASL